MFPNDSEDHQNPYSTLGVEEESFRRRINPQHVPAGDVLSHAWEMFKIHAATLILAFVILIPISIGFAFANRAIQSAAGEVVQPLIPDPNAKPVQPQLFQPIGMMLNFIAGWIQLFFAIGFIRMLLDAARNRSPDFLQLFSGSRWYLRVLGATILLSMPAQVGGMLLGAGLLGNSTLMLIGFPVILIGLIIQLVFWPSLKLIIDTDAGVFESFGLAKDVTSTNLGSTIMLGLASCVFVLLGALACGIGILAAVPYTQLIFAVAYVMMSGTEEQI